MGDHHHLQQQQQAGMNGGGGLDLPPGFRFHPTDEEIITFYLAPKVLDRSFCATAIGEVDLNKSEPWDLPGKAKMGEKEWYFYCQKDRKYPTGMRTNRATEAGYWKATGKDKEIYRPAKPTVLLVGMKKTLVFYKGRAPRGEKTNWVMHEYRLDGRLPYPTTNSVNRSSKDEWVVCRIFHKSSGIKKVMPSYASCMAMNDQIRGIPMSMSMHMPMPIPIPIPMPAMGEQGFTACALPPLMDPSSLVAPPPPTSSSCLAGLSLGNAALPVNGHYFDNHHMAAPQPQQPAMFYQQQMQMEEAAGFMAAPASGPSSMVSQDTGVSNEQNNSAAAAAAEISSVDVGMDGMWKY